jgi:hypothetical protein
VLRNAETSVGFSSRWTDFWFRAADPLPFGMTRIFCGLLFLAWLLPFAGRHEEFFGMEGWFGREGYLQAMREGGPGTPVPLGWSILYLAEGNPGLLTALYWGSVAILAAFAAGVATRITSVLTWVVVVSFTANPAISFEADFLLTILAFYMMVGHVLQGFFNGRLTPAEQILGPTSNMVHRMFDREHPSAPSISANMAMRMLQIHFVVVVLASALHKLQLGRWWAGMAFFFPMFPPEKTTPSDLQALFGNAPLILFSLSLAQYLALGWQFGLPFFAWKRSLWPRVLLLGGGAVAWLGNVWLFGIPLFGPFWMIGCLSLLTAEEWHTIIAKVRGTANEPVPARTANRTSTEIAAVPRG